MATVRASRWLETCTPIPPWMISGSRAIGGDVGGTEGPSCAYHRSPRPAINPCDLLSWTATRRPLQRLVDVRPGQPFGGPGEPRLDDDLLEILERDALEAHEHGRIAVE